MTTDRRASLQRQWPTASSLAGCILFLVLAGCNQGPAKPENMPNLTPCVITVTYNGQPVPEATVILAPKSSEFSAAGTTDASGRAVMKTNAMYNGVVPGEFLVSVTKLQLVAAMGGGETPEDPAEYAKTLNAPPPPPPKSLIPRKYSSFRTSGLTLTVAQGKPVEQAFDLIGDLEQQ